jgi:hypothetical protein
MITFEERKKGMKPSVLYYLAALALSVMVFWFVSLPLYTIIFNHKSIEKPIPERSVMIKNGTGVEPVQWPEPTASKETIVDGNLLSDTLTSRETVYLYPDIPKNKPGVMSIYILSDSLSGCTSGAVYLGKSVGNMGWYESELFRLNGSTDQQYKLTEDIAGEKVRLRFSAISSTQSTAIKACVYFKPTT